MSFVKKVQKMQQEGIISAAVAKKMIAQEQQNSHDSLWKNLFRVAAFFIVAGILMVIGANISDMFNLFYGLSYIALFGCAVGLYKSIILQRKGGRELFAILSFVLVGAILGLIRQKYQLDFYQATILFWCFIGLPYILLSKSYLVNLIWLFLVYTGFPWESFYETAFMQKIFAWGTIIAEKWSAPILLVVISLIFNALFCYLGTRAYLWLKEKYILPNAFALWMRFSMYAAVIFSGAVFSFGNSLLSMDGSAFIYNNVAAQILVFGFLAYRIWLAVMNKNISAISRNIVLIEIYVVYLFLIQFKELFTTGVGLIIIGCVLLLSVYSIRKIHQKFLQPLIQKRGAGNE